MSAVVVPALLLAGLLVRNAERKERLLGERRLAETSRALSLVVDRQLGQAEAVVTALSTSIALENGDFARFYQEAAISSAGADRWVALARASDRQQLVNTGVPYGTPLPISFVPSDYVQTLAEGRMYMSDLFESSMGRGKVLAITLPVRDSTGAAYDLSYVMKPSSLNRILDDQDVPPGWVAAVLDRKGTVVARNRSPEQFVGRPATQDIRAEVLAGRSGVRETVTLEGDAVVAAYSRSPAFGWTVIIAAPRAVVYGSASRLALLALLVAFGLVAIGAACASWVARGIVRSIDALAGQANALGHGGVPAGGATGMRETDDVAEALRGSARRLRAREEDLRRLNGTLEARVAQRTRELAETNRALEARNRELQDFAHVASHDLQEPLRKVQSFGDLLKAEYGPALGEEGQHYIVRMQAATGRMSGLIRDILSFSRVATQGRPAVPVDLSRALEAVRSDLEARLAQTGGRIDADEMGTVEADPVQVHQLLLNLVGNALKFHREGVPPVVRVSAQAREDAVALVVEDNGIGFDEKYADRIFTPFQRLHGRHEYEGTGIGLAIVRRIVERHGGSVSVTSTPGSGSRFEVVLPHAAVPEA